MDNLLSLSSALALLDEKILSLKLENALDRERELEARREADNLKPCGVEPAISIGGNAWVW